MVYEMFSGSVFSGAHVVGHVGWPVALTCTSLSLAASHRRGLQSHGHVHRDVYNPSGVHQLPPLPDPQPGLSTQGTRPLTSDLPPNIQLDISPLLSLTCVRQCTIL